MDKKELDLARSIITSALTPNNKTGMTAAELDEEIYALMGDRLKLPPGCPGLEAFIQRFFGDEIIGTPSYGGVLKYRLIPKADTDYLLKLVARQNDKGSKPLYVAEQAREAALRTRGTGRRGRGSGRGSSSSSRGSARGGRGGVRTFANSAISRLGPPVQQPPRLMAANSFVNGSSRPTSSMDWVPPTPLVPSVPPQPPINFTNLQKAVQQALNNDTTRRPASAVPAPVHLPPPIVDGSTAKFKNVFDRYKICKENGLSMEISCRLTHSKTKLASTDFPSTLDELCNLLTAFVSQCESQPKPSGGESMFSGQLLEPNAFPPVGRKFLGTIARLDSFDRFFVQTATPTGKNVVIPCSLYGATVADPTQAVKMAKEALSSCENQVTVFVKAHKPTLVEVDICNPTNGASIVSYLLNKGLLFLKPTVEPSNGVGQAKVTFKLAALAPTTDQFTARVSAVLMASIVAVNVKSSIATLIEIENALSASVNTKLPVRREDVVKCACFIIRTSQYCRARVLTAEPNCEIRLRLVDHGCEVTISSVDELFEVPNLPIIVETPPLAFYLDLHNLQHHIFQKESCTVIAERELLGKMFEVQVIDRSGKRPQVNLFEAIPATGFDHSLSVNKRVKELILAEMTPKLDVGTETPVVIRFIDWNVERGDIRLHVQVLGFGLELLETIEQSLPGYYEPGASKPVEKDQLSFDQEYVAPYQGCYYRCNLMGTNVDAKDRVQVLFYDYGNIENVQVSDLRLLEEKYSSEVLPNQAVSTRLSGLPPPGKQWVSNASDLVFSTFDSENEYVAKTISFDQEEKCFEVEFKLTTGESVNDKFTTKPELFEDKKATGSTVGFDTSSLASSDAARSSEASLQTRDDKFTEPVLTLPPFSIEKSFDEKDSSVNACIIALNSSSMLSCQLVPNDDFNEMITQMNEFYSKPDNCISPVAVLKAGDVGIVSTGGCFCRAQVQSVGRYSYRVNFVDYATANQIIKHQSMFLLEARFAKIQPMGFELQLSNVPEPKSGHCPNSVTEYGEQLADENPFIKVYPADKFKSDEPCDAIVSVVGRAVTVETGVDINAHIAMLLQQ